MSNTKSSDLIFHSIIVLVGGAFLIYTAVKEIFHMLSVSDLEQDEGGTRTVASAVTCIVAKSEGELDIERFNDPEAGAKDEEVHLKHA